MIIAHPLKESKELNLRETEALALPDPSVIARQLRLCHLGGVLAGTARDAIDLRHCVGCARPSEPLGAITALINPGEKCGCVLTHPLDLFDLIACEIDTCFHRSPKSSHEFLQIATVHPELVLVKLAPVSQRCAAARFV
jgi:hypothetical protein